MVSHRGRNRYGGSGMIDAMNEDGTANSLPGSALLPVTRDLGKDEVSSAKTWQLHVPASVTSFAFNLMINADITPKLVINEVMVNPTPTIDTDSELFELYNAGTMPVNLQGLVIADSAASGRRPYHLISSSVVVQPGGYAVLGGNTNTTLNGGVPVDYAYGGSIVLSNSLDAVKISRVAGTDTVTISRTQFASAAISAQIGIARELKNPALDNTNMDGSNWGDAQVTAVYGSGGRGTPKAQNSMYIPDPIQEKPTTRRRSSAARLFSRLRLHLRAAYSANANCHINRCSPHRRIAARAAGNQAGDIPARADGTCPPGTPRYARTSAARLKRRPRHYRLQAAIHADRACAQGASREIPAIDFHGHLAGSSIQRRDSNNSELPSIH